MLGCYTPQYLQGSFKGVPYDVVTAGSEHGRRGAEGEFPFSETTAYADLGRKIRRYSITARFVQNSHIADTTLFIAACESRGSGLLIHPTRGIVTAACVGLKVQDEVLNGKGETTVTCDFVEAGAWSLGLNIAASLFGVSLVGVNTALRADLFSTYRPDAARYYQTPTIRNTAAQGLQQFRNAYAATIPFGADITAWRTLAEVDNFITTPSKMPDGGTVFDVYNRVATLIAAGSTGEEKYQAFRKISNWGVKTSTLGGIGAHAENSIYSAIRVISAGHMAKAAVETNYATLSEALSRYDQVVAILEQEKVIARDACNNTLFNEISILQTNIQQLLLNKAYNLPALVQYDFGGPTPSLVAAYQIYGDAKKFNAVEKRNPSYHPFMLGPVVIAAGANNA
jgi:prophage DNA circulation protein